MRLIKVGNYHINPEHVSAVYLLKADAVAMTSSIVIMLSSKIELHVRRRATPADLDEVLAILQAGVDDGQEADKQRDNAGEGE